MNNECVDDDEVENGMFVIVAYDFATTSSKKQSTKNILALVLDANDKTGAICKISLAVIETFYSSTK